MFLAVRTEAVQIRFSSGSLELKEPGAAWAVRPLENTTAATSVVRIILIRR
jgi:hypothetical protein